MKNGKILKMSAGELDNLLSALDVNLVRLAECLVSPGWRLSLAHGDAPAIHYNLAGHGRMLFANTPPIEMAPHTLVIAPPARAFQIEVAGKGGKKLKTVESKSFEIVPGEIRRIVAGAECPEVIMICGYFRASYGASVDLFANLPAPIVEQFDAKDELDQKLKIALAELLAQEVGSGAMAMALMKQVLVTILRRSLKSVDNWNERFSALGDPQIARAFSAMVAQPSGPHSVASLSQISGLSRSAFMLRFSNRFGASPMTILRRIRLRHAETMLAAGSLSMDQISDAIGYSNRGSFFRAFQKAYGVDPTQFRQKARRSWEQ